MTTYTYDPNIPAANNAPRNDQPVMQTNAASIQGIISVDHENFGIPTNGYHTLIHQRTGAGTQNVTRSGPGAVYANLPASIAGVNQIFAGLYTPDFTGTSSDTQLFNLTGNGGISQLTGDQTTQDGWAWLGGILIQWGVISMAFPSGSTTGTVIFKDRVFGAIPFPNNCFVVICDPLVSFASLPGSQASINIRQSTLSKTQFNYQFYTNSAQYIGFFWAAIGN